MNIPFDIALAIGGLIGGFLTLLALAAWMEAKRWQRIYGKQHYSVLPNTTVGGCPKC